MSSKLIFGFRTMTVPETTLKPLMPASFKPDSRLKDKLKIADDLAAKKELFLKTAQDQPYTGTFAEVVIADPAHENPMQWKIESHGPDSPDGPMCLAIRRFLLENHPHAWSPHLKPGDPSSVVFVGFNPRRFLKMLGAECSLPEHGQPLPLSMWYGDAANRGHRDIMEAVCPNGFPGLTMEMALKRHRPKRAESIEKWDKLVAGWTEPHLDPAQDVRITAELIVHLGMVHD